MTSEIMNENKKEINESEFKFDVDEKLTDFDKKVLIFMNEYSDVLDYLKDN